MVAHEAQPRNYSIQRLLDEAVQPFDPVTEEELDALARDIEGGKRNPLLDPVTISRDGVLLDGSQRLRALQKLGRKMIPATDVRVAQQVTRANAIEWAVRLNVRRRQLTVEDKARVARRLQAERGWSQSKIAELFGVTRAAVSQWLGTTEPEDGEQALPVEVIGVDGRVQSVEMKRRKQRLSRQAPHPWSRDGECIAQVKKATARIRGAIDTLPNWADLADDELEAMVAQLQELEAAAAELIAMAHPD